LKRDPALTFDEAYDPRFGLMVFEAILVEERETRDGCLW
jgi:hypothetical protein